MPPPLFLFAAPPHAFWRFGCSTQQFILQNRKFVYFSILRPLKWKVELKSSAPAYVKKIEIFFSYLFFSSPHIYHLLLALRRTLVPENVSFPGVYPLSLLCAKEKQRLKRHSEKKKKRTKKNIYIFFCTLLNGFRELKPSNISDFFDSIFKIYSILSEHILSFDLSSFMHSKYYSSNHGY